MKCPNCQAKLLPVDGDLFCLQCGELVHEAIQAAADGVLLEETADPVLRRAINDSVDSRVVFKVPEKAAGPVKPAKVQKMIPALKGAQPRAKLGFVALRNPMPARPRAVAASGPAAAIDAASPARPVGEPGLELRDMLRRSAVRERRHNKILGAGVAALTLAVTANIAAGMYYTDRVYPGVKVNNLAVGGWTYAQLHENLAASLPTPKLSAVVDGKKIDLDIRGVGAVGTEAVEREVEQAGRSDKFPLIAVAQSWLSGPLVPSYELSDDAVARSVESLAAQVDRAASNATPLVLGTNALVLAEKPGTKLDKGAAAAAVRAAFGHAKTVTLTSTRIQPAVKAADYTGEVAAAQAIVQTPVSVKLKKQVYTPTQAQIAGWVVIAGPGKGAVVDPAGAASFVAGIPGAFDRAGAVSSLLGALNGHHGAQLVAAIKPVTANPKPASIAPALPLVNYSYCLDGSAKAAADDVSEVLGSGAAWTLGGRIHYVLSGSNCNFMLQMQDDNALGALDPQCGKQTSCRIHNELAINKAAWTKPPAGWTGDTTGYRVELINHVVGQWLGFDHPGCTTGQAQTPVLSAPSVVLSGCSPNWYAVPAELQDTKVLAGF